MKGEAAALARELNFNIRALAEELLPHGRRTGNWWRVGSLAGEEGQSLAVTLSGLRAGRWYDYAAGAGGDALDLVAQIHCRGDKRQAMDWARDWLRLPQREIERVQHQRRAARRDNLRELREKRDGALKIWLAAKPVERGDPVWCYLEGRGIALKHLPRVPSVLRTHPGLWNVEQQRTWPAMVALIADSDGRNCAVHRTWLEERNFAFEDGPRVTKAPLQDPKLSLGSFRGGYIRLWRGAAGRPWSAIEPGETLLLGEGLEDLLSYVQFAPQWRAACAVSLSFMLAIQLPPEFTRIRILAQRDRRMTSDGKTVELSPARKLLNRVIDRFRGEGRKVYLWTPPVFVKDINEWIRHRSVIGGGNGDGRRVG